LSYRNKLTINFPNISTWSVS